MPLRSLVFLLMAGFARAADFLLLCGADEVFRIDPAAKEPAKLSTWRARDCAEIPAALKAAFATTDDCKPVNGGAELLVTSSGGGCALLEYPSGKALWWARVVNAHSIETLPGGRIAVASSVGAKGDKVVIFDRKVPETPLAEIPLPSAHGLVWDESRQCLWALGFSELIACTLADAHGTLDVKVTARDRLPDEDGHDLRAVPGGDDLILSTHKSVWRFDRSKPGFRPDPDLKDLERVKSIDFHPASGRIAVVRASGENWWTGSIDFLHPESKITLAKERLYKARWISLSPSPKTSEE